MAPLTKKSPTVSLSGSDTALLVEVTRGDLVESQHFGRMAICDQDGHVLAAWGNIETPFYPRSAVKMIQALPLLESGAADHFGLTDLQLSLACASHNGEPDHADAVMQWLADLKLSESHLLCGKHPPIDPEAAASLIRKDQPHSQRHHNCSGKHCGFLTNSLFLKHPLESYREKDHPVQKAWQEALSCLADAPLDQAPKGTDGCGIPVLGVSIRGFATALARFGGSDPKILGAKRATMSKRLCQAMTRHPDMIGGRDRLCTALIRESKGVILAKSGAEATYGAFIPDRKLGIALKIEDGSARAAEVALGIALAHLDLISPQWSEHLRDRFHPPIRTIAGLTVGHIRPKLKKAF